MAGTDYGPVLERQMDTWHVLQEFYVGEEFFDVCPEAVLNLVCAGLTKTGGDLERAEAYYKLARAEAFAEWICGEASK